MDVMSMKEKILEEILDHLNGSQGMDLKKIIDESKMKSSMEDGMKRKEGEYGNPKGLEIEKVSILGNPEKGIDISNNGSKIMKDGINGYNEDEEMTDEELEELLRRQLK
jgi:hypothetical protein